MFGWKSVMSRELTLLPLQRISELFDEKMMLQRKHWNSKFLYFFILTL